MRVHRSQKRPRDCSSFSCKIFWFIQFVITVPATECQLSVSALIADLTSVFSDLHLGKEGILQIIGILSE